MNIITYIIWFTSIAFLYFAYGCFGSQFIIDEFNRYKLIKYRKLVGLLQLLGALGLLIGLYFSPLLLAIAAIGLCILMLLGFAVRLKIKDNFLQSSPSFLFAFLNFIIAYQTIVGNF